MRWSSVLTASLAVGCNEQGLAALNGAAEGERGAPVIQVAPDMLDFGALEADDASERTFRITNVGPDDSILEVVQIVPIGSPSFALVDPFEDFRLPGGEGRDVLLTFSPDSPDVLAGDVRIESNDADRPTASVLVAGSGILPTLVIEPDPLDAGTVLVGCETPHDLTLDNVGTFPLTVNSLEMGGTGFTLADRSVPFDILPGGSVPLRLRFAPSEAAAYDATLTARSSAANAEVIAGQRGAGRVPLAHADHYEMPLDPPIDILFYVDQSCSMADDQTALATNFSAFISSIDSVTPDWHILVATEDNGCALDGVLDRSTPNYAAVFTAAVSAGGGSYTEMGLTVTTNAVEAAAAGVCNHGFLREEALLHAIFVSDEPEQSPNTWDSYVARLQAAKADDYLLKLSAIAGDYPGGCRTTSNSAQPGIGYYEAVAATGGVYLSLCSDWAARVELLSDATIGRDTFALAHDADPSSIEVTVNGGASSAWRWDEEDNSVVFIAGSGPTEGDVIDIRYREAASCD